jgi:hypothetical protein
MVSLHKPKAYPVPACAIRVVHEGRMRQGTDDDDNEVKNYDGN